MVQNVNPTFVKTPNWGATQITTGTGSSGVVTIYSGGVNGSKINAFVGVSIGTTGNFDVQWGVSSGGTLFIHGTTNIVAAAGSTNSIAPTSFLSNANTTVPLALDSDGNPYLFLPSSAYSLQAKSPATSSTWTTGAALNLIVPSPGDF
jgi:hypothetical protein